ncbi:protein of unknown function [Pseudarcicella hirudinis]|uniref:Uncharacterized protein n=2 Tax=Pseudarcicella hirudinis TaxID=1079859 RepID=A0A1I5WA26_9BACT|nr:heparinase II/III family protein [Pseudarcicella hirudinis]SFQ16583.1 protein of unknown function [Pseudarcicella hirudinis]
MKKSISLSFLIISFFINVSFGQVKKAHPYLFFTRERIEILQKRIKTDTSIANNWQEVLKEADLALTRSDARNKVDYLSLAYLMTRDIKYADKVKEVLKTLCAKPTWSNAEMLARIPAWTSDLKTAEDCWTVAIGFDAIYDLLSKEERKVIVEGLVKNGIKPALNDWVMGNNRIHTLNSMGHNWWSACVGMAGVASLAIMTDYPEASEWVDKISVSFQEWHQFNGDELHFKPKTMDSKGGMYESINYAAFGISEYLFFRLAHQNTLPDKPQPVIEGLEKIADFFINASYPRDGMLYSLNFGDGHINTAGERPLKLLWALGYQNKRYLWYINQVAKFQHREGLFVNTPLGLVYHPDMSKIPAQPDLPASQIYEDIDWAMMRNSWEKNATMLGVKSGFTWNHSHADANSFILFHKGEPIIKDAGNSWYGSKEYPEYFFQSQAHNVVTFNGKAQPKEQQYNGSPLRGELSELMDAGKMKYLLANGTGPTSTVFSRNFRHFLWVDKVILIIDDVKAYETGKYEWLLHPGGESKKVGGDISITSKKSSVLVRPLFPETLVQTGFNHDFPEKMVLNELSGPKEEDVKSKETYYGFAYPEEIKQTKFITAIILKDSVNDMNLPQIERLKGENMQGVRIRHNGKITEVFLNLMADGRIMHLNTHNNLNGWETDAYLLGVSFPENKKTDKAEDVSDFFVGYGSYIRKDGQLLFNSLSKLFLISNRENGRQDLLLQGQPLINAEFFVSPKTGKFFLNHQEAKPALKDQKWQIHIGK